MPSLVFPSRVLTSKLLLKRSCIQSTVPAMSCMVPIPPSQAMTVDRQVLSAMAIAFIMSAGIVTGGGSIGPPRPIGGSTPARPQKSVAPAERSASRTSAMGAASPLKVGQFGPVVGAGGGGGGGSSSAGGFSLGRGSGVVWRTGAGVVRRVAVGFAVGVGVTGSAVGVRVGTGVGLPLAVPAGGWNEARSGSPDGAIATQPTVAIVATTSNAPPTVSTRCVVSPPRNIAIVAYLPVNRHRPYPGPVLTGEWRTP